MSVPNSEEKTPLEEKRRGTERVLYGRKQRLSLQRPPVVGGKPITEQQAVALCGAVFGVPAVVPQEWLRTGFCFNAPETELGYGIDESPRSSAHGLVAVVQAQVLRHLLFGEPANRTPATDRLLRPSVNMQQEALWTAIASILWRIGECTQCFICLPQNEPIILSSTVFCSDGITEKLQIFEVLNLEDLHILIKRYLYLFQDKDGPGVLLLLYSAVITRGVERVLTDLNQERGQLLGGAEGGNICIVTLLLTGRATPYLHNGVVYMGDKDHYALPQFGVLSRGEVGLLMWEEGSNDSVQPGSRLKTPSLPVWVCLCAGQLGVLFSTNRELLRNYHAERRFNLHYYTLGGSNSLLNVDTRYGDDGSDALSKSTTPILPLEKLIHTKWQGAHITWIKSSPTM